jgi:hypothetical protein
MKRPERGSESESRDQRGRTLWLTERALSKAMGDSAAGARPAATKPTAASKAMSNVVRMSELSPMSGPLLNDAVLSAISAAKGQGMVNAEYPKPVNDSSRHRIRDPRHETPVIHAVSG